MSSGRRQRRVERRPPRLVARRLRPCPVGPLATPLPQLTRNGELPSVTSVMVSSSGRFRLADLATGTLGPEIIGQYSSASAIMARPDGGWVCICSDWTNTTVSSESVKLTLDGLDQAGAATVRRPYRTITGTADPTADASLQTQLVDARVSSSPDGRFGFIGWSRRDGADGWTLGVDVIDLASLDTVTTREVALAEPIVVGGRARIRTAPAVALSPTGGTLLLSSFWFADDPNASNPPSGTDHWLATFDERTIGDLAAAGGTSSDVCMELDAGLIADTAADRPVYYVACWTPAGTAMVKRIRADGWLVDATDVPPPAGGFDGGTMVIRSRDSVFVWSPFRQVLARFDLETAAVAMGSARTAATPAGVGDTVATLGRRLGQWIAPSVLAKVFLEPGIVVSPDGSRVYALGIDSPDESLGGSAGVFAFDATTLEPVGQWPPLADLMSIAVSADGRYVYAAAMAGYDAEGNEAPYGSSITVYDVADGSVRLVAGQLGTAELLFPAGPVR